MPVVEGRNVAAPEVHPPQELYSLLEELIHSRTLTASEVRQKFFRLLDEVSEGQALVIHRPKHDQTVVLVRQAVLFELIRRVLEDLSWHAEKETSARQQGQLALDSG